MPAPDKRSQDRSVARGLPPSFLHISPGEGAFALPPPTARGRSGRLGLFEESLQQRAAPRRCGSSLPAQADLIVRDRPPCACRWLRCSRPYVLSVAAGPRRRPLRRPAARCACDFKRPGWPAQSRPPREAFLRPIASEPFGHGDHFAHVAPIRVHQPDAPGPATI